MTPARRSLLSIRVVIRVAVAFALIASSLAAPVVAAPASPTSDIVLDQHTPASPTPENESGGGADDDYEINASDSIGSESASESESDSNSPSTPTPGATAGNETVNESAAVVGESETADSRANTTTNTTAGGGESGSESGVGVGGSGSESGTSRGVSTTGTGAGDVMAENGESGKCDGFNVSPECASQSISEWFSMRMYNGMVFLIEDGFFGMLSTPYPENDGYLGVFGEPVGETYSDLFDEVYMGKIMVVITEMMVIGLIIYTLYIMPLKGRSSVPAFLTAMAIAGVIVFSWDVATAIQRVSDEGTMLLLPDPMADIPKPGTGEQEHVTESNWQENVKLNSAPIAVFLGGYFAGWTSALFVVAFYSIRRLVLFFGPLYLGVILVMMGFGTPTIKRIGSVVFWQYIAANVATWPVAILLSVGYYTDFTFGLPAGISDIVNLFTTIGVFWMALGFPLLIHTFVGIGTLAAIMMKGSVANAGRSFAGKYLPSRSNGNQRRSTRGGGYSGAEKYTNTGDNGGRMQQKREIVAQKSSRATGTRSSRRRAVTDGGTPRAPTTNRSMTERRHKRYRKVRGNDNNS